MSTQDQINAAVAQAVRGLEAQIKTLTTECDEERTAKEKFAAEAEHARKQQAITLSEKRELEGRKQAGIRKVTVDGVQITDTAMQVPEALVRNNPAAYRMWKARAAEQNLAFQILRASAKGDTPRQIPDRFTDDRTHYVSREFLASNGALYRQERDFAQSKRLRMVVVENEDQLPEAAFEQGAA